MKRASPKVIEQAIIMRAAGWTLTAISEDLGISMSTIQRACRSHSVKPGEAQEALIDKAKQEFVDTYGSDEGLRIKAMEGLAETLALSSLARVKIAQALEHLNATDAESAAITLRAIAAGATATKTFADASRHSMPEFEVVGELPEFVIRTMTDADVKEIRRVQEAENESLYGCDVDDTEELN
jgi:hypothetical protein